MRSCLQTFLALGLSLGMYLGGVSSVRAEAESWEKYPRLSASIESGFLAVLDHKIQFSRNNTNFDYLRQGGQDTLFAVNKFSLDLPLNPQHTLVFLYQPLSLTSQSVLAQDITQDNISFAKGTAMKYLYAFPVLAGLQRFEESGIAYGGDNQSKNEVRQLALLEAKRQALEKAGTYVQSFTFVRNAQLEKDEILLFTAGVTQTKILKESFFFSPEGLLGVKVTAQIEVDSDVVAKEIQRFKQNQDIQVLYRELMVRNKQLEQELKKIKSASEKTERGQELVQEAVALDYVMRGVQAYQKGQAEEAITQFSLALKEYPRLAIAYNNRGFIWMKKGFFADAENDFNQAIACNPNYSAAWFNRAGLFWRKQESAKALKDLGRALELEPKMARALYNRALIYAETKEYQAALADLQICLRLIPNHAPTHFAIAEILKHQGLCTESLKFYQQACQLGLSVACDSQCP